MRKTILLWSAALGLAATSSSCVDPYYSSPGGPYTSVSGSYSTSYGYGAGYGYGNPNFSTSIFVSTGNSRWGYDPYCYSYYDYHRRCYYDPYLNGYYPIGYRPPVVIGCPHPYGWRPGSGYCPPPRSINNVTVVHYNDRQSAYRRLNHSWARNVRTDYGSHSQYNHNRYPSSNYRPTDSWRPSGSSSNWRPQSSGRPDGSMQNTRPGGSRYPNVERPATLPSNYNQPVTSGPSSYAPTGGLAQPDSYRRTSGKNQDKFRYPERTQIQPGHNRQPKFERPTRPAPEPRPQNTRGEGKKHEKTDFRNPNGA